MAVTALEALYGAVYDRLTASPTEPWESRVSPDLAPSGTARPHVVYAWAAGGEVNQHTVDDAEFVLMVSGYALTQATAFALCARLSALLNDADADSANELDAGDDWLVLHTKQEQAIHRVERIDGVSVYREGFRLRVRMEATVPAS